ncbi:MAG: hypothetical protein HYZ69_04160 [Candidatus Colwellbacteria bacterium]|nr:hypothetical protein [Candidatus Colwellbacteria bacterium]
MRSRDIFLAGMAIPIAIEFGAQQVITEGFAETGPKEPFSGQPENIEYFNSTLRVLDIPVQVAWRDRLEMDTVMDLFENEPEWMPHVCNCFASPCYLPSRRAYWQRNAPSIDLYNSQCGSCVKCRIVILGRMLYDPKFAARRNDIIFFLENTDRWLGSNKVKLRDMVAGSFRRDFITACSNYGVRPKTVQL